MAKTTNKTTNSNKSSSTASKISSAFGVSPSVARSVVSAFSGGVGGGGSSSGSTRTQDNPLIFDTPAYQAQFRQTTPTLSSSQRRGLESSISSFAISNPNFKDLADVFAQQIDAQKQIADMQKQPNIPFEPAPQPDIPAYGAFVDSVGTVQDLVNQQSQEQMAWESEIAKIQKKRAKLAQEFDLGETYQDLQQQYGVPQITKQLQEANLQLSQMQSQYQLQNQALAQQTVPQPFIIGQQNELQKTAAITIGAQASYVQALQGNLELANHYVDKMIELEAMDYERKYQVATDNLNLALNFLDRADRKQAQAIQFQLDLRRADYTNMLDVKKSSMQNALLNGASQSVVQAIARAETTEDVYSAAGRFAVDPTIQAQLETERLQQERLRKEIDTIGTSGQTFKQNETVAAGYATRVEDASQTIKNLESFAVQPVGMATKYLPNIFKSSDRQQLEQAERNFINAQLRRESGAVISDEEFVNARKQYIPQPGDTQATLEQKARNRDVVFTALKTEAGGAYDAVKAATAQAQPVSQDASNYIDEYLKSLQRK